MILTYGPLFWLFVTFDELFRLLLLFDYCWHWYGVKKNRHGYCT
jgi:hypothetical protein